MMGKLGKIQKSRKHKKVKPWTPYYEEKGEKKKPSLPEGPNRKPGNLDDQEVPRSVKHLMKMSEMSNPKKMSKKEGRRKRKDFLVTHDDVKGMKKPLKPVPEFKQRKNESEQVFFNRMERETKMVIAQAQFEKKFKVDVDKIEGEEVKYKKRSGDNDKKKIKNKERNQKKKDKIIKRRDNKKSGFEDLKDDVQFGEVAMAPPTLTAKPRKSEEKTGRPGKKSLLLQEIIRENQSGVKTTRTLGQTVKRKNLSMAKQHSMDVERQRAIDLYREMKNKKMKKPAT